MKGYPIELREGVAWVVDPTTGCWQWQFTLDENGYGNYARGGRRKKAHRVVYELFRGPIPSGLPLDHLCRNRRCVNPEHLDPVPQRLNTLRGENFVAAFAARTHCDAGHPFAGDNLELREDGARRCRECQRKRQREAARKRRRQQGVPVRTFKLTAEDAAAIRRDAGRTLQRELAVRYGVSRSLIGAVLAGKIWRGVLPDEEEDWT